MPHLQFSPYANLEPKSSAQNSTALKLKTKTIVKKTQKSKEKREEPELVMPPPLVTRKILQNLIFTCKWDEAINILDEFPFLARNTDNCGDLPLHAALWFHAPDLVIMKLIDTYPEGTKIANNRQCFPLHIAASSGSSSLVIEKLLLSYPEALDRTDKMGNSPRDCVKTISDEMNRSMIMMPTLFWIRRKQHDDRRQGEIQENMKTIAQLEAKLKEPKATFHTFDASSREITQRLNDISSVLKSLVNDVASKSNFLFSEIDALQAFVQNSTRKRKAVHEKTPNEYTALGEVSLQDKETSLNATQNNDQKPMVEASNMHVIEDEEKCKRQKTSDEPDTTRNT